MEKTKHTKDELKSTDAMNREMITDGMNPLQVANEEDPFRRLPKEVMLNIFGRLADLKSLCRYSLVSKHFAEAIYGVRTVSINLSGNVTYNEKSTKITSALLNLMQPYSREEICQFPGRFDFRGELKVLQNLFRPSFLQKLTELESVYLEYEYPQSTDPFPMWKMNFVGGNSLKIEGLVALMPAGPDSIRVDCCDRKFLRGKNNKFEKAGAGQINSFWLRYYGRFSEWLCLALILAKTHASVSSLTINDPGLNAKLVMDDKLLAKLANTGYATEVFNNLVSNYVVRVARIPILHLPLTGYVMRWPSLVIIHAPDVDMCSSAEKLDEVMFGDSGEEFERLREAVSEVFENHADEIMLWGSITNRAM